MTKNAHNTILEEWRRILSSLCVRVCVCVCVCVLEREGERDYTYAVL